MISIGIPNFNRTDFVIESFIQVINNENIDDIVIVDDCSSYEKFLELSKLINILDNSKIKLYRNDVNLKPLLNKYETVKKCKNDWVILLDSDNIINNDYIDLILKLEKEDNILYCPETLITINNNGKGWCYNEFNNIIIDKTNAKNYIDVLNFETLLNTGNYFFNRKKYEETIENNTKDTQLSIADAIYFSYLWLLSENKIIVVPELKYTHRIHNGSYYINNSIEYSNNTKIINSKIKEL